MLKNKALGLLMFGTAIVGVAKAQNPSSYYIEAPRTFYGGLVAGANFTQVDGDNYAGYRKIGMNVGGIVYTKFDQHLALSLEILYSQKGARGHFAQRSTNGYTITDYNVRLNYAEVPIQLCYFDRRRSHFGAGFSVARLVSVKENGVFADSTAPVVNFEDYPFRKMDYNFIIGGSLHIWQGLFVNARFQYSLRPVREGEIGTKLPPEFSGRRQQYNNMWTVRLMYVF